MQDFQFYVTDDRLSVRALMFVQTKNAERARLLAKRLLLDKHHHAVEVWADERRLFTLAEDYALPA